MADVFLSYSRKDQDAVAELVGQLERRGFNIWWDGEIPPGENFRTFIDRKLNEAPAICVVWSANSVDSRWVAEEAEEGVKRSNLIPIAIDDTELPRGFRGFQCVQLQPSLSSEKYEEQLNKLDTGLRAAEQKGLNPGEPQRRPSVRRRGAFEYKLARTQNLWMFVFFTALALTFAAYDRIVDPNNFDSLWFRLGIMLPTLFVLTATFFFARRPWQLWITTVFATWASVVVVYYQCRMLDAPEFAPSGLGTALNVAMVLVASGVGLAHTHTSRAAALFGGVVVYASLAYAGGANGVVFWLTMLVNSVSISVIMLIGMFLRDRRVR